MTTGPSDWEARAFVGRRVALRAGELGDGMLGRSDARP